MTSGHHISVSCMFNLRKHLNPLGILYDKILIPRRNMILSFQQNHLGNKTERANAFILRWQRIELLLKKLTVWIRALMSNIWNCLMCGIHISKCEYSICQEINKCK